MNKSRIIYTYYFHIQGYEKEIKEESGAIVYHDVVLFNVYASSYEEAVEKAKLLYPKKGYRLTSINEEVDGERMRQLQMDRLADTQDRIADNVDPKHPWE